MPNISATASAVTAGIATKDNSSQTGTLDGKTITVRTRYCGRVDLRDPTSRASQHLFRRTSSSDPPMEKGVRMFTSSKPSEPVREEKEALPRSSAPEKPQTPWDRLGPAEQVKRLNPLISTAQYGKLSDDEVSEILTKLEKTAEMDEKAEVKKMTEAIKIVEAEAQKLVKDLQKNISAKGFTEGMVEVSSKDYKNELSKLDVAYSYFKDQIKKEDVLIFDQILDLTKGKLENKAASIAKQVALATIYVLFFGYLIDLVRYLVSTDSNKAKQKALENPHINKLQEKVDSLFEESVTALDEDNKVDTKIVQLKNEIKSTKGTLKILKEDFANKFGKEEDLKDHVKDGFLRFPNEGTKERDSIYFRPEEKAQVKGPFSLRRRKTTERSAEDIVKVERVVQGGTPPPAYENVQGDTKSLADKLREMQEAVSRLNRK